MEENYQLSEQEEDNLFLSNKKSKQDGSPATSGSPSASDPDKRDSCINKGKQSYRDKVKGILGGYLMDDDLEEDEGDI